MKHLLVLSVILILLAACGPSLEQQATLTSIAQTATAAAWTYTPTPTQTFTPTSTFTSTATDTPSSTFTPTISLTPTLTLTPTFDFPKVTVNKALAACLFGPAKAYMWARDLMAGDTGIVWGRAPIGNWLFVKMDKLTIPCWVSPSIVDVEGNIQRVIVQPVWLPQSALYGPPQGIRAERKGDEVTVHWDELWMTQDDDRGYFFDIWLCQGGISVWMPTSLPDQYENDIIFIDEPGCSSPSGGKLYGVEKHGYTSPVDIPWPPYNP